MSGQYLVPLQLGLMCIISLVVPLNAFLRDSGINDTCNTLLCCAAGLLIMGLMMLWGHHVIQRFYKR